MQSISADGNSATQSWPGGVGTFWALGTWGSGTLKLQYLPRGMTDTSGNWIDVPSASFTANGMTNVSVGTGSLRVNLDGSTSASLNFDVERFLH